MNEQEYTSPIRCDLCGRIGARWEDGEALWLCADSEACLSRYLAEESWALCRPGEGLAGLEGT